MSRLRLKISTSLDGFVAGPNQSVDNPLGIGGMRLHEWAFALEAWREPHGLEKIVSKLRQKGYNVDSHARVASAPRGYSTDHPRIDLLRMKDIFAGKMFEPEPWLSTRRALEAVKDVIRDVRPLVDWIKVNLGAVTAH